MKGVKKSKKIKLPIDFEDKSEEIKEEIKEEVKEVNVPPIIDKDNMSDLKMNSLLIELSKTDYYKALLRFFNILDIKANNALRVLDPATDSSQILKQQGLIIGVNLLPLHIEQEETRIREESKKLDNKEEKNDENIPNYNGY